jgi:hypothetical protein
MTAKRPFQVMYSGLRHGSTMQTALHIADLIRALPKFQGVKITVEAGESFEALKFYADPKNWERPDVDPVTGFTGMSAKTAIERDGGAIARKILV